MAKKTAPRDFIPQQERFPTTADGLVTNARPTKEDIDYPTVGPGFEVPLPDGGQGHDAFMYKSHTQGKKEE